MSEQRGSYNGQIVPPESVMGQGAWEILYRAAKKLDAAYGNSVAHIEGPNAWAWGALRQALKDIEGRGAS